MKQYIGLRTSEGTQVYVEGAITHPLNPRFEWANHSPTGFEWGYSGSGPAQLALALLGDYTGDREYSLAKHQQLKEELICKFPQHNWILPVEEIERWVKANPISEQERYRLLPPEVRAELIDKGIAEETLTECCGVPGTFRSEIVGGKYRAFVVCPGCGQECEI